MALRGGETAGQNAELGWKDEQSNHKTQKNRHYKYPSLGLDAALNGWMGGWMDGRKCFMKNMAVRTGTHVLFARTLVLHSKEVSWCWYPEALILALLFNMILFMAASDIICLDYDSMCLYAIIINILPALCHHQQPLSVGTASFLSQLDGMYSSSYLSPGMPWEQIQSMDTSKPDTPPTPERCP